MLNIRDRNAGFAAGQEQVWGFDARTGIDSRSYFAPGAKIFYVDQNNTLAVDAGNLGENPTVPLATVAAAIVLCRDHQGDTIVVGANDAWQYAPQTYRPLPVTESVTIPMDKGGIRIVGSSTNPLGVSWTPAGASEVAITVHAVDVIIEGFCFIPEFANCIGILCEWGSAASYGENLTVRHCFFESSLDYGIQYDFSWYCYVYQNYFDGINVAAIHNLAVEGDPDYLSVTGNVFDGCAIALDLDGTDNMIVENNKFTDCPVGIAMNGSDECTVVDNIFNDPAATVAIDMAASDANAIHGNIINGDPTGTNNFIDATGSADNIVSDNFLACTIAQYDVTCSDATSGAWVNNHCTDGDTVLPPV